MLLWEISRLVLRWKILHFTVVCLVAKSLNRNEASADFDVIQTLLSRFGGNLFGKFLG